LINGKCIRQSIDEYNGSAVVAMQGHECVAIATDTRLGVQMKTISTDFQKVFQINDSILLGMTGLATDIQTASSLFKHKCNMYKLREGEELNVSMFASMVGSSLYEKRFGPYFVTPIVAGLEKKNGKYCPYLCNYDYIGI
jgi:20S proteasome subunit beta 3